MQYARVRGGRVWHVVSAHRPVTVCGWKAIAELRDPPQGPLCKTCYAIREEQGQS